MLGESVYQGFNAQGTVKTTGSEASLTKWRENGGKTVRQTSHTKVSRKRRIAKSPHPSDTKGSQECRQVRGRYHFFTLFTGQWTPVRVVASVWNGVSFFFLMTLR